MVGKSPELVVKITGNPKDYEKALAGLPETTRKGLSPVTIAATGAAVAFGALAAGAAQSVQEFKAFEKGFSDVVTLLDKSSFKTKEFGKGVDDLKSGLIGLRASTGQTFENLNKGLFDLVSAGVDAESAIEALGVATDLALAGATDTSTAVDGLTSAINAYGLEANEAQDVAEKFFTAQKFGKTTIEELSASFGKVGATAASMGVSLDEVLASVSAVTLAGVNTSEAYTGLKAAFANIIKPSKDAAEEAERLGINFDSTALKARGLEGFLNEITSAADFNAGSLERLFGSTEALNVILALTGGQADSFKTVLTELADEEQRAATFADSLATKQETLDFKFSQLEGSASALRAEIGERLSPAFGNFADNAVFALDTVRISLTDTEEAVRRLGSVLAIAAKQQSDFIAGFIDPPDFESVDPAASIEESKGFSNNNVFQSLIDSSQEMASQVAKEFAKVTEAEDKLEAERKQRETEREEIERKLSEKKAERDAKLAEKKREREEAEAEREAEKRQDQLDREDEQFEEDVERLTERLEQIDEIERDFEGLREVREAEELSKKARNSQQKQKIDEATAKAGEKFIALQQRSALDSLQTIFDTSTAFGKALFLFNRALAIADTIKSTQQASMLAYGSQLIIGDPSSIARAEAARLATIVKGAVTVGAIAATSVAEVTGAREGGIVAGGVFGRDTQPFMLARDEIVVPSRLNPLSPNFEDTFGGGGFGGSTRIDVGFDGEEASRVITIKQREDTALGVQR